MFSSMVKTASRAWIGLTLMAIVITWGCGDDEPTSPAEGQDPLANVLLHPNEIRDVPIWERYDSTYGPVDTTRFVRDEEGVCLILRDGVYIYNPISVINCGLALVSNYRTIGHPTYLRLARSHVDRLLADAVTMGDAIYFPHPFRHSFHGLPDPVEQLTPPWYGGLAQGRAIGLFVRLNEATGEERYLEAARQAFNSIYPSVDHAGPVNFHVDEANHFWIDETPREPPDLILNGFIYSLLGVYDYYQETRDPRAEKVLRASFATLRANIENYRVPGDYSYYCAVHHMQSKTYHRWHVMLLRQVARMSGDLYFAEMANLFEQDGRTRDGGLLQNP